MATTKPRITFTTSDQVAHILQRLADIQNRPLSKVVSEYIEMVAPVLERIADAMEGAAAAQEQARAGIIADLEYAQQDAEKILPSLLDALSAAAAHRAPNPRSCNHGGQLSDNDSEKVQKEPSKKGSN